MSLLNPLGLVSAAFSATDHGTVLECLSAMALEGEEGSLGMILLISLRQVHKNNAGRLPFWVFFFFLHLRIKGVK